MVVDGKLARSSSSIYKEIGKKNGVDSQCVYLNAKRYFAKKSIFPPRSSKDETCEDLFEEFGERDNFFSSNIKGIDLFEKFQQNTAYLKGVRSLLREIVWKFTKICCCWQFYKLQVVQNEILCYGKCKNLKCQATIFINTIHERMILQISVKNINLNVVHLEKSCTTGEHKTRVDAILKQNTPYVTRAILAAEMLEESEDEAPHLPRVKSLRMQKYRNKKNESDRLDSDPVMAIAIMKSEVEANIIHDVCIAPFKVTYSTPLQKALVQSEKKNNQRFILSMDATGISVVLSKYSEKSTRSGLSKRCFLYVITLQRKCGDSMPVFQMITQEHSSIQINTMLATFKSINNIYNNEFEIIMDQSAALLLSTVLTFTTSHSVHAYLDHCFECLFGTKTPPSTFIRLDRSHVVKSIMNNKLLKKGVSKHTTSFYRRLLGYIIQERSIPVVSNIAESMLSLMNKRYLHDEDSVELKNRMSRTANSHKIDNDFLDFEESQLEDILLNDSNKNKFYCYIQSLSERVHESMDEMLNNSDASLSFPENAFYAPSLEKPIIDFLSILPLAGNIMNSCHKSKNEKPTSSPTENDFNILKNDLFKKCANMRVDEWLTRHIKFTKGRLIGKRSEKSIEDSCDEQSKSQSSIEEIFSDLSLIQSSAEEDNVIEEKDGDDSFDDKLEKFENFRGLGDDPKKPAKKMKRSASSILNPLNIRKDAIPILSNGYSNPTGKPTIVTEHTCTFDSIFQIYAACYVDIENFDMIVESDLASNMFGDLIHTFFSDDGKRKAIYNKRNKVLYSYFNNKTFLKTISKDLIHIDCECTFDYIFRKICENNLFVNSLKQVKHCSTCNREQEVKHIPYIPINVKCKGFQIDALQNILCPVRYKSKQQCEDCKTPFTIIRRSNSVIVFDIDYPNIDARTFDSECETDYIPITPIQISKVPSKLLFDQKEYRLFGILERKGMGVEGGHHVAHIKRDDKWETYDDMVHHKPQQINENASVKAVGVFYVLVVERLKS